MRNAVRNARSRYRVTSSPYAWTSPSLASSMSSASSSGRPSTRSVTVDTPSRAGRFRTAASSAGRARLGLALRASLLAPVLEDLAGEPDDAREHVGELHRDDELCRRRSPDLLQRIEILEAHGLRVDRLSRFVDLRQGQGEALGSQDRRLLVPLGLEHDGAPGPLGRHLAGHGLQHRGRGDDLPDLHVRDLHAPSLGDLVELHPEDLVHLFPLGQHVVQGHVTHHRPERGRCDVLGGAGEVADREHALLRIDHLVEHDEVDGDGRVVLGDGGLVRDLQVLLPKIHPHRPVHDGNQEHEPGALHTDVSAQAEHDQALVLPDDPDGLRQHEDHDQQHDPQADEKRDHGFPPSANGTAVACSLIGSTSRRSRSTPTTRTRVPLGRGPATDRADHCSDDTSTTPSGSRSSSTTPSLPTMPSIPPTAGMWRAAIAALTTVPKNRTSTPATGTMTHSDTRAFGTDGLNSVRPPRTRHATPPTVATPSPGCFNSSRKNSADASSRTTPMICTGRSPNVTNAATRKTMPMIPGTDNPGWSSSTTINPSPR